MEWIVKQFLCEGHVGKFKIIIKLILNYIYYLEYKKHVYRVHV
jgi:hypothetical protein